MAYQEMGMVEVREIVRRWLGGDSIRAIARGTGMDRKTVRAYVRAAGAAGVARGGGPPTERTDRDDRDGTSPRASDEATGPECRARSPATA
jgi:transposase